jgi:hypothetical protein
VSRAAALLVRLHHAQLLATPSARVPLVRLQQLLRERTQVGLNNCTVRRWLQ